jgi:hypothetical protein
MARKKKSETINQASETNTSTEEKKQLYLVYIKPIGVDSNEWYEYDFYYSSTPDIVWGYDWDCEYAAQGDVQPPDRQTYDVVKRLKTIIPLACAQDNNSFGMRYAVEGIIALAFEDSSDYDDYPDDRIVLLFGEKIGKVEDKLGLRQVYFADDYEEAE